MTPKAIKASAVSALVVFVAFAALLSIALNRATTQINERGYGPTSHAIKPALVGIGN